MSIFLQNTLKVDHEALQCVYNKLDRELRGSHAQIQAYYKLRHAIHPHVNHCADNVKLTIYINDVDIVICAGNKENEMVVTIEEDGNIIICWPKETQNKSVKDGIDGIKQIPKSFLSVMGNVVVTNPLQIFIFFADLASRLKTFPIFSRFFI